MADNTQIVLVERPTGKLEASHFEVRQAPMPAAGDGQVVVRNILLSQDAANRAWMQGETYRKAMGAGEVMDGYGIGVVTASKSDKLAVGDIVGGVTGWQDYSVHKAHHLQKMPAGIRPLSHLISLYGIAGKTAYHGLIHVGQPKEGETVLVSAAAGSVGSVVGQLARAWGCRAVGIAGGPEKCRLVTQEFGFDACVDYKAPDLQGHRHCRRAGEMRLGDRYARLRCLH